MMTGKDCYRLSALLGCGATLDWHLQSLIETLVDMTLSSGLGIDSFDSVLFRYRFLPYENNQL